MNCYKCYSSNNLSIKNRKRDGQVRTWICRACRRADHLARKPEVEKQVPFTDQDVWREYATSVNKKIALKYKDKYIIR